MTKSFTEMRLFLFTLGALAAFQIPSLWLVPPGVQWPLGIGCLVLDGVLLAAYLSLAGRRERTVRERFQHVNEVLGQILAMTRTQQSGWKSVVEGLSDLETEDQETKDRIRSLVSSLQQVGGPGTAAQPDGGNQSVESLIDSLQTMILLNHSLMTDLDAILDFYHRTYLKLREIQVENKLNHFRLDESVEFLGEMGKENNQYSEKLILDILGSFQEITRSSKGISTDVMMTIHLLMDTDNTESLQAINVESAAISKTMDQFFEQLGQAIAFSQKSMEQNIAQMDRVKVMAETIADFSESIRMISLNLNIEAARAISGGTLNGGRGFQVLAVKLSEFAQKAQDLAEQQNHIIGTASSVVGSSGQTQMAQLNALLSRIPEIQAKLDPFARIVKTTYSQFEGVVSSMEHLSTSIDERLQAVIGKFQFQDLVRQQQSHILTMFGHIRDLAVKGACNDDCISNAQRDEAMEGLLSYYESISTTENEIAAIRAYRRAHPQFQTKTRDTELTAGSVQLF